MKNISHQMLIGIVTTIALLQSNCIAQSSQESGNPLLEPWNQKYGGVPPFDKIKVVDFKPAIEQAAKSKMAVVEIIATNPDSPNFANTILALDTCGTQLEPIMRMFSIWNTSLNSSEFRSIRGDINKLISGVEDRIIQDDRIFKRIEKVYKNRKEAGLTGEQLRLTEIYYNSYLSSGAGLSMEHKATVTALNTRLLVLQNKFLDHILTDESNMFIEVTDKSELIGLNQEHLILFSQAAKEKRSTAPWVILNKDAQVGIVLRSANNRGLRKKVWHMYQSRGLKENNEIIEEILKLRIKRSQLFGYKTYTDWRLTNTMIKSKEEVESLLKPLWTSVQKSAKAEIDLLQSLADIDKIKLEPWDITYYTEKLRKSKYDVNQNEIREYLSLDNMRNAMFWVAGKLFGFSFQQVDDVPVFHPDVKVWKVTDTVRGRFIGLFYFDPYARDGKNSVPWAAGYRRQQKIFINGTPITSVNCNFNKPAPGEQVLLTWREAEILFHEFGHALNMLCQETTYPFRKQEYVIDFVEFPSQLLENWVATNEAISRFAIHYQTHKPMPAKLVDNIQQANSIGQAIHRHKLLANAMIDFEFHRNSDTLVTASEILCQFKIRVNELIGFRYEPYQFLHIFDGESNSSTYYGYTWSLVMADDAYAAFIEAGSLYDPLVAAKFRKCILSTANTVDPKQAFWNFRGRNPDINAFIKRRIQ